MATGSKAEGIETAAPMADDQEIILHGDFDLTIIEARGLPNMDLVTEHLRRCFIVCEPCTTPFKSEEQKAHHRKIITSDPYVTVCLAGATVARTRVISNSQNPRWDEHFSVPVAHPVSQIEFHVKDNDVFGAQLIGTATISAQIVSSGEPFSDWIPVLNSYGKPPKKNSALRVDIKFIPSDKNSLYQKGIAARPEGVRNTYFPVRRGGAVKLYQDAHVPEGLLPPIELEKGKVFKQGQCWEDICHAILEAHHLIYIVGWSVFHKVKLVRERSKEDIPSGGDLTLGELLKYKSQEGVRVVLLVWDDKTSHSKFFLKTARTLEHLHYRTHFCIHFLWPPSHNYQVFFSRNQTQFQNQPQSTTLSPIPPFPTHFSLSSFTSFSMATSLSLLSPSSTLKSPLHHHHHHNATTRLILRTPTHLPLRTTRMSIKASVSTTPLTQDDLKKLAAYKAVESVSSGMVLGLGTGSTAAFVVDRIGELLKSGELTNIVGVPTSKRTQEQAASLGIPLSVLDDHPHIDLAIDGADEVDPLLNLVKGRGGALLREKMVEAASDKFIVVADDTKLVTGLGGSGLAMPVEVVQFCWKYNFVRLQEMFKAEGCEARLRLDGGRPYVTDNSNYIVDLYFTTPIKDAAAAGKEISALEGVVEHGLFLDMATMVIIAGEAGVTVKVK